MIAPICLVKNYQEIQDYEESHKEWEEKPEKEYHIKDFFFNPFNVKVAFEVYIPECPVQPVYNILVETEGTSDWYKLCGPEIQKLLIKKFS